MGFYNSFQMERMGQPIADAYEAVNKVMENNRIIGCTLIHPLLLNSLLGIDSSALQHLIILEFGVHIFRKGFLDCFLHFKT